MAIKQKSKSLKSRGTDLSNSFIQLKVLNGKDIVDVKFPKFASKIKEDGYNRLKTNTLEIFQLNIGKLCNQTCAHCHVDAGPDRREENMGRATLERCLEIIKSVDSIHTVDITGGAPEMNPHFKWFVEEVSAMGKQVIDRCNLTIIRANKKYHDLPQFFKKNKVHVISSLPYFSKKRTDNQRGDGVFEDSIKALQMLNEVGYGKEGSGLKLDLVYNPSGAFLPSDQASLEAEFKRQLKRKYNREGHVEGVFRFIISTTFSAKRRERFVVQEGTDIPFAAGKGNKIIVSAVIAPDSGNPCSGMPQSRKA